MSIFAVVCLLMIVGLGLPLWLHNKRYPKIYTPPEVKVFDLSWPPLVLDVDLELKRRDERLEKAVISAATYWNQKTDLTLFIPPGERCVGTHTILILPQPKEPVFEQSVVYTRCYADDRGSLASATIYVRPEAKRSTAQELDRVFTHALGHCLGLTHDGIHGSVMYGDESNGIYSVLDRDVVLLRSVYGIRL
jgi:hypothetical protein